MDDDTRHPAFQDQEAEAAGAAEPHPSGDAPEMGMEELLREADFSFRRLRRGETVEGTIVRVDPDEVLVDIGLKSEGVIPARELWGQGEDIDYPDVGERVLVYVIQPESQDGHAVLSLRRAQMERSWREIEDVYQRGAVVEAPVVDFNKGGLIVDVKGIRGFVPVSQILDLRNVSRQEGDGGEEMTQALGQMKGRRLPLKVIEINRSRNRLILSERSAVQDRRTQRKDELIEQLEPGQIRHGVVSNITSFGAFIDLGGADGLVHVSELSYNRVNHPSELLHVGQEVDVYVLSVDRETKKIALSLKRAQPDPWSTVEERYHIGEVVPAVITKLQKFGAFAKVQEGLEGLIHLSELTDLPVTEPSQVVREGQPVNVKIIHINAPRRRLGLSVRQANQPMAQSYGETHSNTPFADTELGSLADTFGEGETGSFSTPVPEQEGPFSGGEGTPTAEPQDAGTTAAAEEPATDYLGEASAPSDETAPEAEDAERSHAATASPHSTAQ